MSNPHHEAFMERLYDEAWEELHVQIHDEEELHLACVELAKKRWEFDYD